jgi:hypothetical protein
MTQRSKSPDSTHDLDSSIWYQNIVARQKQGKTRQSSKKFFPIGTHVNPLQSSTGTPLSTTCAKKESLTLTTHPSKPFTTSHPTTLNTTINSNHQAERVRTQYEKAIANSKHKTTPINTYRTSRHPLTSYPFFSRNPFTMTALSKLVPNKHPDMTMTAKSPTLVAIARAISAKIQAPTQKETTERAPQWTMPTKANRTPQTFLVLPKTVPVALANPASPPATKFCIPITVRMNKPRANVGQFDKKRILTAILNALQAVEAATNIHPTLINYEAPDNKGILYKPEDIPSNETDLNKYLEFPETISSEYFCARILVNSNNELYMYKKNPTFMAWLKYEEITMERNPIPDTIKPVQIGFITHMIARADHTSMYEHRIQQMTSNKCPPFAGHDKSLGYILQPKQPRQPCKRDQNGTKH